MNALQKAIARRDTPLPQAQQLKFDHELKHAGWWPLGSLSEECRQATSFPKALLCLGSRDQDGLYQIYVHKALAERFLKEHEFIEWKSLHALRWIACLF